MFQLLVSAPAEGTRRVREGETDIGVTFSRTTQSEIKVESRQAAPMMAVMRCGHPLARFETLSVSQMSEYPLALPDIGDRQIIVYSRWDRPPELIEAQITQPIVSALLGAPHVKSIRGVSDVGASFVYVILEDDADLAGLALLAHLHADHAIAVRHQLDGTGLVPDLDAELRESGRAA